MILPLKNHCESSLREGRKTGNSVKSKKDMQRKHMVHGTEQTCELPEVEANLEYDNVIMSS